MNRRHRFGAVEVCARGRSALWAVGALAVCGLLSPADAHAAEEYGRDELDGATARWHALLPALELMVWQESVTTQRTQRSAQPGAPLRHALHPGARSRGWTLSLVWRGKAAPRRVAPPSSGALGVRYTRAGDAALDMRRGLLGDAARDEELDAAQGVSP